MEITLTCAVCNLGLIVLVPTGTSLNQIYLSRVWPFGKL